MVYLSFAQILHVVSPLFDNAVDAGIEEDEKHGRQDVDKYD